MTLLAFAAERRAAVDMDRLLQAGCAAIDRYRLPPGPQQQTRHRLLQQANGTDRRTDGRTDSFIDGVPHTMPEVSKT